jgi:antitoxin ParD1/3/4
MGVTLSQDLQALIEKRVATGEYASAEEVVADAIRMLDWRDARREELLREIDKGLASVAAGRSLPALEPEALIAQFRARATSERKT